MKCFILKIIEKPEHGQMGYTQCRVHSLEWRYDSIHLHEYLTPPIKPGLGKLPITTIQQEVWLVVVSRCM